MRSLKVGVCARSIILAGVVMGAAGRAGAKVTSSTWDGSSGNNWSDATHWKPMVVPSNNALMGVANDFTVTVPGGQVDMDISVKVNSLTVATGAEVDAGTGNTLTVGATGGTGGILTNNGILNLDGLTVNGDASNGYSLVTGNGGNGTITGNLTNTGVMGTNATGTGTNTFSVEGTLINDGYTFEVQTGTTATVGALTQESGSMQVGEGASLEVTGIGTNNGTFMTDVPGGSTVAVSGNFTVLGISKGTLMKVNGLSELSSVEGTLVMRSATQRTTLTSLSVSTTGMMIIGGGAVVNVGALTNAGSVQTNYSGVAGTNVTLTTMTNEAGGNFLIASGVTVSVGVLNNAGTVMVEEDGQDFPELDGSEGTMVLGGGNAISVSVDSGTSTNLITDNGAGATLTTAASGTVQTGAVRVGTLNVQGRQTIDAPGVASKVSGLEFGKPGGIRMGLQLLFGTPLVVEDVGEGHGALVADLRARVLTGQTNYGGIYFGSLTSGQVMVVSDFGVVDGSTPQVMSFDGVSVDSGSVVVMPAWRGDANLDGVVDIQDLTVVANHWQENVTDWRQGDFDGNGMVDILDLTAVANQWQSGVGGGGGQSFGEALAALPGFGGTGSVPEPMSLGILGIGAVVMVGRRRRGK